MADISVLRRLPERCSQCGDTVAVPGLDVRCRACLSRQPAFARIIYAFDYSYPADLLIHGFKEQGRLGYAGMFGDMLWRAMQSQLSDDFTPAHLVPVPAGPSSLLRRGFNPAGEVARALSQVSGIKLSKNWLARVRDAPPQKSMTLIGRRESVDGLYRCEKRLPAVWVGLVDDVMTTGSTMQACSQALIAAGAAGVVAVAVARTPQVWQNANYVSCHSGSARNPP